MARLHLMVGLPCSGKTTFAKRLEREVGALRLTPDEWHTRLFGQDAEDERHEVRHNLIEAMLWEVAARALELGIDVILDFGFWSKEERDDFRSRARALGATAKLYYLSASDRELLSRLAARNEELPHGAFEITAAELREWIDKFEAPTEEELEQGDH